MLISSCTTSILPKTISKRFIPWSLGIILKYLDHKPWRKQSTTSAGTLLKKPRIQIKAPKKTTFLLFVVLFLRKISETVDDRHLEIKLLNFTDSKTIFSYSNISDESYNL